MTGKRSGEAWRAESPFGGYLIANAATTADVVTISVGIKDGSRGGYAEDDFDLSPERARSLARELNALADLITKKGGDHRAT